MPELPDVEVYRRYINATALHQRIMQVHVESPSILFETSPQSLGRVLKHRSFSFTDRHGKYLFIAVDGSKWLVMHFGMTGDIKYFKHQQDMPEYTQCLISFENGYHLAYIAPRKLGRIALTDSPQIWIEKRELGPDALGMSEEQFIEQANQQHGGVKSWLMNQQNIAGIGNIYSDEILFQAGIHPGRSLDRLDRAACRQLYQALHAVMDKAIRAGADPDRMPAGFLLPHRRPGGHCPVCGGALKEIRAAGRTAWYCPRCQPNRNPG